MLAEDTLYIVTVTLLICGVLLILGRIKRWMVVMSAACAFAVGATVFKTQDPYMFMTAILECIIALIMIYVLQSVLQIVTSRKKRTVFSPEETISLTLGALIVVCMFGPLSFYDVFAANIVAMFLVLCAAYTGGAALGAGVGLALGLALCLSASAPVMYIGMLGLSGMVGGTVRKLRKIGAATGFLMINLLFVMAFSKYEAWYLALIEIVASVVLFLAVPRKPFAFAGKFFDVQARREFEYKLHSSRFRELTVGRLKEVSQVFMQTGEMFTREAAEKIEREVDISGVLSIVAETTCKDCVFRKSCWDKDFLSTYNVFGKLFLLYERSGSIDKQSIDAAFVKKCFNINGVLSAAESIFSAYLLNVKWRRKIDESRLITGKQLKGVAKVVSDIGREMDTGFKFLESVEQSIAVSLDALGIHAKEVCAERSASGMAVAVRIKNCGSTVCRPGIDRVVSSVCGAKMKRVSEAGCGSGKLCTLRFEQTRKFSAVTGVAALAKGDVSGDSFSFLELKDGRFLIMLCDGMGSGESAKRESAAAVSLIENFYQAGFDESVIFDTINRLLILKGTEDMFSTVDICLIDLKSGSADFTKIGAECSYLMSGGRVSVITPGSLPIGIIEEAAPVSTRRELVPGDIIVMMSDGVADMIKHGAEGWLSDIPKEDPQETADVILQKALSGSAPSDDMTVMVCLIAQAQ
jgi:stage II sporulation protein E